MKKNPNNTDDDAVLEELRDIKRLLILTLARNGAPQSEIAAALNINQSSISRMFPDGFAKKKTRPHK